MLNKKRSFSLLPFRKKNNLGLFISASQVAPLLINRVCHHLSKKVPKSSSPYRKVAPSILFQDSHCPSSLLWILPDCREACRFTVKMPTMWLSDSQSMLLPVPDCSSSVCIIRVVLCAFRRGLANGYAFIEIGVAFCSGGMYIQTRDAAGASWHWWNRGFLLDRRRSHVFRQIYVSPLLDSQLIQRNTNMCLLGSQWETWVTQNTLS